jgi:hypothetical protein
MNMIGGAYSSRHDDGTIGPTTMPSAVDHCQFT